MPQNQIGVQHAHEALNSHAAKPEHVIAIGFSAGGLEVLKSLLNASIDVQTTAIIIVYHSAPNAEKQLQSRLQSFTDLSITIAEEGENLRPNTIFIVPPSSYFSLKGEQISLRNKGELDPKNLPIDHCFKSLAQSYKDKAVGIVLSGAGSDGSQGLKAIKEGGGLCLTQNYSSAEHSSMPINARKASQALALNPGQMFQYISSWQAKQGVDMPEMPEPTHFSEDLQPIIEFLSSNHGVDFSYYQTGIIQRRLRYRLEQLKLSPKAYYHRLRLDDKEVSYLLEQILVVVTEFFRDGEAFNALQNDIIKPLVQTDEPLRIWVAGCATGQEAYSLAIKFFEAFRAEKKLPKFKIFATDMSAKALKVASKGQYKKESLADISQDLLEAYFQTAEDGFEVSQQLRKAITFAKHNLYNDPPFTKMHLISCRNLLIYFKDDARRQVLNRFHFSLKPDSYLFLGPSETTDDLPGGFRTLNERWKLYKKLPLEKTVDSHILSNLSKRHKTKYVPSEPKEKIDKRLELLAQVAQEGFLLSQNFQLLETFGSAHQLIRFPEGRAELNIFALLEEPIAQHLRACLHRTARTKTPSDALVEVDAATHKNISHYQITTKHFELATSEENHYFVHINPIRGLSTANQNLSVYDEEASERVTELEILLERKDEELQRTIEALETTNEELMSSNEELMSSNEELQSVNEELNSVNEELHTVNAEYQDKLHAVTQANNDLINLQNVAQVGTVFVDKHLRIRSYSPLLAKNFNFMIQDIGRPIEHLIHSLNTELDFFRNALKEALESGKASEFEALDRHETPYWVRLMPYMNDEGECDGAVLSLTEIAQLKQAQTRLEEHNRFAENLIAATPGINYIYVFGQGRRTFAGNDFPSALGYPDNDESADPTFLTSIMHSEDVQRLGEHNERLRVSKAGEVVPFEFRVKHAEGHWVWLETRETVHKRSSIGDMEEILGIALDISSRKRVEERLQHDALHDSLTGLRNRLAFTEHLQQTHRDFLRYPDQNYAVLFIDLDRFKAINDSYGHAAGDHVLTVTAKRVQTSLRDVDIVARHSGDEFLVLLKNLSSVKDAKKIAHKIIQELEKPIEQDDLSFEISASIGIAMANPDQSSPEFLINSADIAMYKSKESVGKKVHFFDDSLHLQSLKQVSMEHDLRLALRENQLCVHYQPIIDTKTQKIIALEALARWPYKKGFISPAQFIPLAENTHLIGKIDKSIFDQACRFIEALNRPQLKINLNLSASQLLNPNTIEYLLETSVDPRQLCLEITESQLLLNNPKAVHLLKSLSDIGYHIAIDDFGTGYSSLAYLQSLPATTLKIDRSFVQSIETNDKSQTIIAAIMNLAKSLDYKVVAEGIENDAQYSFVKSLNCDFAQGYLFSQPLSPDDCKTLLNTGHYGYSGGRTPLSA